MVEENMKTRLPRGAAAPVFLVMAAASTAWAQDGAEGALASDPAERAEMTWSTLDADGSGEVSRAEFETAQVRVATERFETLDKDGNKALSAAEYQQARAEAIEKRSRLPWFVRRRVPEPPTFEEVDSNHNDGLSLDEWLAAGQKRRNRMFDRADGDDNGTLSKTEFEQWTARMKRFAGSRTGN